MVAPQVPFTALAPVLSVKSKLPEEYEPATPARMSGPTRTSTPTWPLTLLPFQSTPRAPGSPRWWYARAPQLASWVPVADCCGASVAPKGIVKEVPPKSAARPAWSPWARPRPPASGADRLAAIDESPFVSTRRCMPIPLATASTRRAIAETVLEVIAAATCGRTRVFSRPARCTGSSVAAEALADAAPVPARLIADTR